MRIGKEKTDLSQEYKVTFRKKGVNINTNKH